MARSKEKSLSPETRNTVPGYPANHPIPPDKIDEAKLNAILSRELTQWSIVISDLPEDPFIRREELFREYVFANFDQVMQYMSEVATICNMMPHHPRWENEWTTLRVYITTWDSTFIITYKDIMLARNMDRIYNNYLLVRPNAASREKKRTARIGFIKKVIDLARNGHLDEANHRLIQLNTQPYKKEEKEELDKLIGDFQKFQVKIRQQQLPQAKIKAQMKKFEPRFEKVVNALQPKPRIFFSYAWDDDTTRNTTASRENIVDRLYKSLEDDNNYELFRDKKNIAYKGLITDFMKQIGKGDIVIVVFSDKYLRSDFCMFELYEVFRNSEFDKNKFVKKIFPIKIDDALNLSNATAVITYLEYWQKEREKWGEVNRLHPGYAEKMQRIINIESQAGNLLQYLADMNLLTPRLLSDNNFNVIKKAIVGSLMPRANA